ncbi:MAG: Spy/CpxP family protein refolding chaperone [Thermosynechococcaceae cyanobacterium]
MKIRSMFLVAAAVAIPTISALSFNPAYAERAYSQPSERVAQRSEKTPEQREAKRAEREAKFKTALGLSDQQSQDIQAIRASYKPQMKSLWQQAKAMKEKGASREEMKPLWTQKQALRTKMYEEIKAELTPEQVQKLDTMKAQMKGRHDRNHKGTQDAAS